ncbi:acyl carrier protein [Rudaeicoccus suwonensis]|uniref:Phosphopantetheine binding protein n=1 Tax=Rudaeicoccus suwonensis TaxID=657409 RepID=A0A561DVM0_9MICO|nr:acyl carrier protein [Rudaeicoccus suwonensis]TWE07403.1 phosphopantetheine binding protein [Rudaeicoccus suwonensis]
MSSGNETNDIIREKWCSILGVDSAGPEQNFFEQGGDSLSAVEFVSSLAGRCGIEIPLDVMFTDGTLQGVLDAAATN